MWFGSPPPVSPALPGVEAGRNDKGLDPAVATTHMSDEVRRVFVAHDAFEYDATAEEATGTATVFDATATASVRDGEDGTADFSVTVTVPTLSAAVEETVGDAVADGWYETFELRMAEAYDVTRVADGDVSVELAGLSVRVVFEFTAPVRPGVDDAAALVDYTEGTYVQGTIPGYTYRDPVAALLSAAYERGQGNDPDVTSPE